MRLSATLLALSVSLSAPLPVHGQAEPYQRQAREIYARLISFRTAAGHGQVPAMARYIEETLRAGGVPAGDILLLPHGETVALLVRLPGGDASARPILFSGHMDVVDARPEDWERDPFTLIEENGYFFGRGTGDNKAGIASMVSTILRLTAAGERPARPLVFGFIGDEETGMQTTHLVAGHEWVRNAEYAINTDAGGGTVSPDGRDVVYGVQGAEKTFVSFRLMVRNPGGHSSRPRADNAIYELAEALLRIRSYQFPVIATELTRTALGVAGKATAGELGVMMVRFSQDPQDTQAVRVLRSSPETAPDLSTTCVATMLSAGHAENALPQRAEAVVNCRLFPGTDVEAARAVLTETVGNPHVQIETQGDPQPSPVSEPRQDVMAVITRDIHARHPGVPVTPYLESGGTDGKVYRSAGIPTWASSGIFMKDSDMFFHGLNERIPVAAFYEAIDHIHFLARELSGR